MNKQADCTILVLTYKGKHHLELLLPTVRTAIENSKGFSYEVLIVDNGRDEPTMDFVRSNYPDYIIQPSLANDYLFSLNPFVEELKTPFVFILNDDMKLEKNVLNEVMPLIKADKDLFSVGCNVLDWEGTGTTVGVRVMEYSRGWMSNQFVEIDDQLRYTLYGGGGAAVFRTSYFNKLEGFNPLLRPAYGEDLDLGYRAWHRAWPSILNPKAILYHRDGATIKEQFTSDGLEQKILKNSILCMLRNTRRSGFLFWFFLFLPIRYFRWQRLKRNLFIGLKQAIPSFSKALKQRFGERSVKLNDQKIMDLLNKPYELKR